MATVYRKSYTKPLPERAKMFTRDGQRFARWKDGKGKTRTANVTIPKEGKHTGEPRIVMQAATLTAKYRDGSGVVREVATGCRHEQAARQVLADLVKRAEHVKGRIITPAEDAAIDHQAAPLNDHVTGYLAHLTAKGGAAVRIARVKDRLGRLSRDCGFGRLADMSGDRLERWLAERQAEGMAAATRNSYREAAVGFANWCRRTQRIISNPFANVPIANVKADRRHQRRSLTESELMKLLDVARRRPLQDAMTVRRGKRQGQAVAQLRPETVAELERLGLERALIYKTLVLSTTAPLD